MDAITKKAIKKTILRLRRLLEKEDIPAILKQHGIFPDGRRIPTEKIVLLDDAGKSRRERLEAIIERETISAGNDPVTGVKRYCREVAFTYLNRLIALRCMEMRALIDECIKTRGDYAGRSLKHHRFRREYPEARFDAEDVDGLKAFLYSVFGELQNDIKILFDPDDEYSIIMPSLETLRECIRALNEDITEDAFKEPELIGWVYQYFQTEEKDRVFEEVRTKKKKIEGDDIVPATSLYTERYMVDYLVQNSLGAIWMEMYPDSKLCEEWPYFVKDQDLKPREPRPIKSLTFLDPACGSGHFLLVAFDLLIQMYQEEARFAKEAKVPKEWVVPKEKIATTIIESNLHGIDIDLRSVQLSWLVLYLKMREHQNSVDAAKFLPKKVNLVAADASLLDAPDFLSWCEEKFKGEPYVLNIIKGVAKRLHNLSEIGSLARPEEDLKELIKKEKERLLLVWNREKQSGQMLLFQEFLTPEQQELPFEKVTDVQFWDGLTKRFLRMLDVFLKRTREEMRERLFATDLQRVIVFLDLCRKRYDVVATNPPYMGKRNMGPSFKANLRKLYPHTFIDLYAAFIERGLSFVSEGGILSIVTQQSFMFITRFFRLRKYLLSDFSIHAVAHLGSGAFSDISGAKVNTALFIVGKHQPNSFQSWFARLLKEKLKQRVLREICKANSSHSAIVTFRINQKHFRIIKLWPFAYWIPEYFYQLFQRQKSIFDSFPLKHCLVTGDVSRFTRYFWEVDSTNVGKGRKFIRYMKSNTFCKYFGNTDQVVLFDEPAIRRIEASRICNADYHYKPGLSFSLNSSNFSTRIMPENFLWDVSCPAIFPTRQDSFLLLGILNSEIFSYFLSILNPTLAFNTGDVGRVPVPERDVRLSQEISSVAELCVNAKRMILKTIPNQLEYGEKPNRRTKRSRIECINQLLSISFEAEEEIFLVSSLLHSSEGAINRYVFSIYKVHESNIAKVLREQGLPVGWHPLIAGYDTVPATDIYKIPKELLECLDSHKRTDPFQEELSQIKIRLRSLYEAGPGAKAQDILDDEETQSNKDQKAEDLAGKHIPIPTETFLEELSVKMEIHPISIYWLLKEMREEEGVVCWAECKRYVEDYFTVMILGMLGFRWPKQVEAGEGVPEWADKDGIIPITDHSGEKTLFERIRDRIGSEFGEDRIDAIEQEFSDILYNAAGKEAETRSKKPPKKKLSLSEWLDREFFKRHSSQFKKRPIAWHLTSSNGTFQALLFYHRLSGDILKNLKNRYLARVQSYYGVLLERARSGESVSGGLTPGKLQDIEAELEDFAAKLDKVINLPYEPLTDDGVRVNIAPLQKVDLLKHPVLAAKDVDRAILDRNRWHEDDKEQNTVWRM